MAVPLNVYYWDSKWPEVFIFSIFALLAGLGATLYFAAKLSKKTFAIENHKELWFLPIVALIFQFISGSSMSCMYIGDYCRGFLEIGAYFWWVLGVVAVVFSVLAGKSDIKSLFKKERPVAEDQESTEEKPKKKINLKYILEIGIVILLIVIPTIINACIPRESADNLNSGYVVTEQQLLENAKQLAVNECCAYTDVSRVRIEYGTEYIYPKGSYFSFEWYANVPYKVELKGSFYPVDEYGDYGDRHRFSIVVYLNEAGRGLVEESERSISLVRY